MGCFEYGCVGRLLEWPNRYHPARPAVETFAYSEHHHTEAVRVSSMTDPTRTTVGTSMTPDERRRWHRLDGSAKADTSDDAFCTDLEARGLVACYDSMFGNNYYVLTSAGGKAFYGE